LLQKWEGLVASSQVDKESLQKEEEKVTTEGHLKGSKWSHNQKKENSKEVGIRKMSNEELEREMVEIKVHLSVLEEWLQEYEEDQRYGWRIEKRKVSWHSLQVKLRQRMFSRLKEELRATECEMEVWLCGPERRLFLDEDEARNIEEKFLDSLVNCSEQHGDVEIKALDEEPYDFNSNFLCMFSYLAGNEHQINDMFVHVNEGMKLVEEMVELEEFLIEHMFEDLEDNEEVVITREDEENQMKICVSNLNDGKPSFGRNSSATEQDEGITQGIEECMTMMTTTRSSRTL
jgi:hypothetical protein